MSPQSGSCICGDTRYELAGDALNVVNCHCGICRKMNGASFSTYVVTRATDFLLLAGDLQSCDVGTNATRHFCSRCGTPIYNENPMYEGLRMLHLGSLDSSERFEPTVNIYCDTQVGWLKHVSSLTSLDQGLK